MASMIGTAFGLSFGIFGLVAIFCLVFVCQYGLKNSRQGERIESFKVSEFHSAIWYISRLGCDIHCGGFDTHFIDDFLSHLLRHVHDEPVTALLEASDPLLKAFVHGDITHEF